MDKIVVEAQPRAAFGKGANRKLRAKGMIPAIVYGEKQDSIPVAIDPKVLIRILRSDAGANRSKISLRSFDTFSRSCSLSLS